MMLRRQVVILVWNTTQSSEFEELIGKESYCKKKTMVMDEVTRENV